MKSKYTVFFLAASLVLLSCSKNEIDPIVPDMGPEIEFNNITTKAVESIEDIKEFEVSLAVTKDIVNPEYVLSLENEKVYRPTDGGKNVWTYDNTRYWMDGMYYYFVASYSYDIDSATKENIGAFQIVKPESGPLNYIGYSIDVNTDTEIPGENSRIDILTASDYVYTNDEWTTSNVALSFSHLLTKINFRISQDLTRDDINEYYITKVSLEGVKNNGTYILVPENGGFIGGWRFDEQASVSSYVNALETGYKLSATNPNTSKVESTPLLVWGEDGLLLIPQDIENGKVKIKVEYTHKYVDDDTTTEDVVVKRSIEAYVPKTDLWKSNNHITYNISIANPNKIIFGNPTVEQWGKPQTGGMIIIK